MIRLFKVKEKQRELAENANGGAPVKKQSAGELRLHKGNFFYLYYHIISMLLFFFLMSEILFGQGIL